MMFGYDKKITIGVIIGLLFALNAQAATTGSISLSGNQPIILEITVTTEPTAATILLSTDVTDQKVGTVVERSNKKAGYTVTLSSASAAATASSTPSFRSIETVDTLAYTIKYGGAAVVFVAGAPAEISNMSAKTSAVGVSKDVTISYTGSSSFLDESIYTDVLTFTILAK